MAGVSWSWVLPFPQTEALIHQVFLMAHLVKQQQSTVVYFQVTPFYFSLLEAQSFFLDIYGENQVRTLEKSHTCTSVGLMTELPIRQRGIFNLQG